MRRMFNISLFGLAAVTTAVLPGNAKAPHRLLPGNDAYEGAMVKLNDLKQDFTQWEAVGRGADFPKVKTGKAA